jgi:cyanophycinase-like exopeptidase
MRLRFAICLSWLLLICTLARAESHQYIRLGQPNDITTKPAFGIALLGGGDDLDDAFRWLCEKAHGGDFLILRARGDDEYNAYVNNLCHLNSVSTLIIASRHAAQEPEVAAIIRSAEAVFIAGGDQALYVNFWQGTPVQEAINANLAAGKPIGGTSAGLAVLGEFVYGSLADKPDDPNLSSPETIHNPYFERVTLVRNFLKTPHLEGIITDSHFAKRDRLGRSLGFLARIMQDGWSATPREIAVDEKSGVLVEADGKATIVGPGDGAWFIRPESPPAVCTKGTPLTFDGIAVYHAPAGSHFNLGTWTGEKGLPYTLSVAEGVIRSTQAGGKAY